MTLIKLISDDKEREAAILANLREYDINAIHRGLQDEATQRFNQSFERPNYGLSNGLRLSSSFGRAVSEETAPVVSAQMAIDEYEQRHMFDHRRRLPSVPDLTIHGTVYRSEYYSAMTAFDVLSRFTGKHLPTFADVDGDEQVTLYSSLDLAASMKGTRYVMERLGFVDERGRKNE